MNLSALLYSINATDTFGLECTIQTVEADLRGRTWNIDRARIIVGLQVRGKVKKCVNCCKGGFPGETVTGSLAFRLRLEIISLSSYRVYKTIRIRYFVGLIDG